MNKIFKKLGWTFFVALLLVITSFTKSDVKSANFNETNEDIICDDINPDKNDDIDLTYLAKKNESISIGKLNNVKFNMVDYFKNLTQNFPENNIGTCTVVSFTQLLTYYDTFYNDNIIPENFEVEGSASQYNGQVKISSPGVVGYYQPALKSSFAAPPGEKDYKKNFLSNKQDYADFINNPEHIYKDYQTYLLHLSNEEITTVAYYSQYLGAEQKILDKIVEDEGLNFKLEYVSKYFQSTAEGQKQAEIYIKKMLDAGYPLRLSISNSDKNEENEENDHLASHSAVAYYYDDAGIHMHFGWHGSSTDSILSSKYDTINYVGFIKHDRIPHRGSNNYFFKDANNNTLEYCGCGELQSKHMPYIYDSKSKYLGEKCKTRLIINNSGEYKFTLYSEYDDKYLGYEIRDINGNLVNLKRLTDKYYHYTFSANLNYGTYYIYTWFNNSTYGTNYFGTIGIVAGGNNDFSIDAVAISEKLENENVQVIRAEIMNSDIYRFDFTSKSNVTVEIRNTNNKLTYRKYNANKGFNRYYKAGDYYLYISSDEDVDIQIIGSGIALHKVYSKTSQIKRSANNPSFYNKFTVSESGLYTIDVVSDNPYISITVYDQYFNQLNGEQITKVDNSEKLKYTNSKSDDSVYGNFATGVYYLKIYYQTAAYSSETINYKILVEGPENLDFNTCGTMFNSRIGQNQIDRYSIEITKKGPYLFDIYSKSAGYMSGKLYNSNGLLVGLIEKDSLYGSQMQGHIYLDPGTYTLDIDNKSNKNIEYGLTVVGNKASITRSTISKIKTSIYCLPNEKYYYKFNVTESGRYNLELISKGNFKVVVTNYEINSRAVFNAKYNGSSKNNYSLYINYFFNVGTYYMEIDYISGTSNSLTMEYVSPKLNPVQCSMITENCDVGETEAYKFEILTAKDYTINYTSTVPAKITLKGNSGYSSVGYSTNVNGKSTFKRTYHLPKDTYYYEIAPMAYGYSGRHIIDIVNNNIKIQCVEKDEKYYDESQKHTYSLSVSNSYTYKAKVTSSDGSLNGKKVILEFYDQYSNKTFNKCVEICRNYSTTFSVTSPKTYQLSVYFQDPTLKGNVCVYIEGGPAHLVDVEYTEVSTVIAKNSNLFYKVSPKETGVMNFDILGQYPFTAKIYTNEALSSTNYSSTYSTYFSSYKASIEYYMYSGSNYYLEIRFNNTNNSGYVQIMGYDLEINLKKVVSLYDYCPVNYTIRKKLIVKTAGNYVFSTTSYQYVSYSLKNSDNVSLYKYNLSYNGRNYYSTKTFYLPVGTYYYELNSSSKSAMVRLIVEKK